MNDWVVVGEMQGVVGWVSGELIFFIGIIFVLFDLLSKVLVLPFRYLLV